MKTFVKILGPQNNQSCDKIPVEISNSRNVKLTRRTRVTDISDVTVENV